MTIITNEKPSRVLEMVYHCPVCGVDQVERIERKSSSADFPDQCRIDCTCDGCFGDRLAKVYGRARVDRLRAKAAEVAA